MDKETYNKIDTKLNELIKDLGEHFDSWETTEELTNLPYSFVVKLKKWCNPTSKEIDRMLMLDLYHTLGMGDLTATQQASYLKKIKTICSYRPKMNAILGAFNVGIEDLPEIPCKTSYHLMSVSGVTLQAGSGEKVVEDVYKEPEHKADKIIEANSVNDEGLPTYKVNGNQLYIRKDSASVLHKKLKVLPGNTNLKLSSVEEAMLKNKSITGIQFIDHDENYYHGIISESSKASLVPLFL